MKPTKLLSTFQVVNLRAAPEYNGFYGKVLGWHKVYRRWEVELYSWSGLVPTDSGADSDGSASGPMSDARVMDQAYHLKAKGTEYVGMGQWEAAAERYREAAQLIHSPKFNALDELPSGWKAEAQRLLLSCWLNEAQCALKLDDANAALALCTQVLDQPSLLTSAQKLKAHYRRHQAHLARLEHEEALEELAICEQLDPKNEDVRMAPTVMWAKRSPTGRRGAVWRHVQQARGGQRRRRRWGGRRAEAAGKDAAVTEADEGGRAPSSTAASAAHLGGWGSRPPCGSTSPWTAPCWAAW